MRIEILKDLFLDAIADLVYFPYWWYSRGLDKTVKFCLKKTKQSWQALALGILLVNFFKPMYGEKGFSAYLLSFMVRSVQLVYRSILMIILLILILILLILWLFLPLFVVWKIFTG